MTARDRLILIVVAGVAALGAAWFLGLAPRRQQASALSAQVNAAQSQLNTLQSTLAQRQSVKNTFAQSYAELTRLGEAVPAEADVPSLLYQIQSVAQATGVDFQSIHVAAGGTSGAGTPATPAPAAATPGAASATPAPAFSSQSFSFTFAGNFFHLAAFFRRLENAVITNGSTLTVSGRLLTLNSINLTSGTTFPNINATVTATAYTLPPAQGLLAGATAAGPAPATPVAAVPSATPSPSVPTPSAVVVR